MNNSKVQKTMSNDKASMSTRERVMHGMAKRRRSEQYFQWLGKAAIAFGILCLLVLFTSIISKGMGAFTQTYIKLEVAVPADEINKDNLAASNFGGMVKQSLRDLFPDVSSRKDKRALYSLVSQSANYEVRKKIEADPSLIGQSVSLWVLADDEVDMFLKGHIDRELAEDERRVKDNQIGWIDTMEERGLLETRFNTTFFTSGDSRDPESAGIMGAVMGSFYTLVVTLLLSFPIGVAAAIYLEEFAPKNRLTDLIEVNINNLAAVPSIVFGLLGLAVFINFFGLPRSAPFVGGLVLTLMTLPTIIISSRAALKSVPPSIREAALGVGASPMQTIFYHVLPLAMPGMLTGTIIGMAQALGESAPLLMIGMVAFIVDIPGGAFDPSTVLPVQIYLWADSPERAFVERTSAAIMVLLGFLILMNALAVLLRRRFERRW
jgi:phosphate transport system permease protein